jgi:hypothetical protein
MAVLGHPQEGEGSGRLGRQRGGSRSVGRVLGRCSSLAKPDVRRGEKDMEGYGHCMP